MRKARQEGAQDMRTTKIPEMLRRFGNEGGRCVCSNLPGEKPDTVTCNACGFSWCDRCNPAPSARCWNEEAHGEHEPTTAYQPTKRQPTAPETGTTRYKVWVEVEEIRNEGTRDETYQTLDLPFGSTASFDTLEEAEAFAERLHRTFEEVGA